MQNEGLHPWVIVTCKGRLEFLRRTAPGLLEQDVNYCLVDYDCPERSGEWLLDVARGRSGAGQVRVVNHAPAPKFHKTHAQNIGAREAIRLGATHLLFSDADTIHFAGSIKAALALVSPGTFVIAGRDADDRSIRSLTGFIALLSRDFIETGGYDEEFVGWGAEDLELRLRMHLQYGMAFRELDHGYLEPIQHSDALRTEFMEHTDHLVSYMRNWAILNLKLQRWMGVPSVKLGQLASRLLMSLPSSGMPRTNGGARTA